MFDFSKAASAVADLDSRLEQLANQQKITNGLLALLVLERHDACPHEDKDIRLWESIVERAFSDPLDYA